MKRSKDDMMFDAISMAIDMQRQGYKVTPTDVFNAMEYEKQIEQEGFDDED